MSLDPIDIAKICHEANRAYCQALGDNSQASWAQSPDWQQLSAINGVRHAFSTENPTPADSYNSWLKEKEADGWKYGPIKSPATKEHPCFVPYDQLPESQKLKDKLFLAICSVFKEA